MNTRIPQLLNSYPIISDQITRPALAVVLRELEKALQANTDGAVVEFGCYKGTTSLFIRRLLNSYRDNREFHAYDSFEGLPPKTVQDRSAAGVDFQAGELFASKRQLTDEFHKAHLKLPIIHKRWFANLTDTDIPDKIAYAFLDGDFYRSILTSVQLVWPRLAPGAIITIDDYQRETLPGVEQAVHDFFQNKTVHLHQEHNIAIIRAQ